MEPEQASGIQEGIHHRHCCSNDLEHRASWGVGCRLHQGLGHRMSVNKSGAMGYYNDGYRGLEVTIALGIEETGERYADSWPRVSQNGLATR